MKRHLAPYVAAPCCALAILFAACSGGTDAVGPDDGTPAVTKPAPDTGDGDAGDDPDTPDTPDDTDEKPDNLDNPGKEETDPPAEETNKELKAILQEILKEEYESIEKDITGEISQNKSITLTAQTIKAVSDIFSDSVSAEDKYNTLLSSDEYKSEENKAKLKKALVANAEEKISITMKEKNANALGEFTGSYNGGTSMMNLKLYNISSKGYAIKLFGEFDYFDNHIESLKGDIDISEVEIVSPDNNGNKRRVLTSLLKKEIYEKLNLEDKDKNSLPKLSFDL